MVRVLTSKQGQHALFLSEKLVLRVSVNTCPAFSSGRDLSQQFAILLPPISAAFVWLRVTSPYRRSFITFRGFIVRATLLSPRASPPPPPHTLIYQFHRLPSPIFSHFRIKTFRFRRACSGHFAHFVKLAHSSFITTSRRVKQINTVF